MRKKIILMANGTETLDFFSRQLEAGFQNLGCKTFLFNQAKEEESAQALARFAGFSDAVLVTFNFDGIHYETSLFDGEGRRFWDIRDIPCVNIAVDHPFYYPELFAIQGKGFYEVSIDRFHQKYMKTYYPELESSTFLPLGGTSLSPDGRYKPLSKRKYDVVFTGNFVPKETFLPHINRLGREYAAFYQGMIDELIQNPGLPDDFVMEKHLRREFPEITPEELKETMGNLIFIDTYIRFFYREKVVKTLADNGIHVHCVGHGWDKLACTHPGCLTYEPNTSSLDCLKRMADARISLNVMPWFKDGAHDRVFNAMANGSICFTDHSIYLDEILSDGENALFYGLEGLELLPEKIKTLLNMPSRQEEIAANGFELAIKSHTWHSRAKTLYENLLGLF